MKIVEESIQFDLEVNDNEEEEAMTNEKMHLDDCVFKMQKEIDKK